MTEIVFYNFIQSHPKNWVGLLNDINRILYYCNGTGELINSHAHYNSAKKAIRCKLIKFEE